MMSVTRSSRHQLRDRRRGRIVLIVGLLTVLLTILAVRLLVQTGGSQSGEQSGPQSERQSGASLAQLVNVSGKLGAPPVVTLEAPVDVRSLKSLRLIEGSGRTITAESPVLTQVYRFSAEDGTPLDTGQFIIGRAKPDELGEEFTSLVIGQAEGSRLLVIRPLPEGNSEIAVVDVLSTIATGEVVPADEGPLQVTMTEETPTISHGATPPGKLTVQTLIRGKGPQVELGDDVLAHYLLARWGDGVLVTSSWADGLPGINRIDDMWPGLIDALVDQRVGSRIAVTIPADQANGEDTIVAVIDVLGTVHHSTTQQSREQDAK